MTEPHPQRCRHSKICVWNKGRPNECLDTDCESHEYVYASHSSAAGSAEKVLDEMSIKIDILCKYLLSYTMRIKCDEKIRELRAQQKGES